MSDLGSIRGTISLNVRQAVAAYAQVRAANTKTMYALRGSSESFIASGKAMAVAGAGLLAVIGKMVTASASFQRQVDFIGAVSGTSGKELNQLSDYILNLSENSIYSANQIADGFTELAKAGIPVSETIHGVGQAMIDLATAADISMPEAGQIITTTMAQFQTGLKGVTTIVKDLTGASNATIADITDLGVSLKYVGGIAHLTGVSLKDTTTALAILAQAGIRGSTAGTSMRQILVSLPGATQKASDALQELGIITKDGTNRFYDLKGNLRPLPQVFALLKKSLSRYNAEQQLMFIRTIFNNRALGAVAALTHGGAKGFNEMWKAMQRQSDVSKLAAARTQNLAGAWKIFQNTVHATLIKDGTPLQKMLTQWVHELTRLVKAFGNLSPKTQETIVKLTALTGVALVVMGAFNIIVGEVLKFVGALIKLRAGLVFVAKAFGLVEAGTAASEVSLLALIPVWGWIALAVIALVAALVILYKKWTPFRKLVNKYIVEPLKMAALAVWNSIKAVIRYFKSLGDSPGEVLKNFGRDIGHLLLGALKGLRKVVGNALGDAASAVGSFADRVISWFLALPGRILSALGNLASTIGRAFTLKNILGILERGANIWLKFWATLGPNILTLLLKGWTGIFNFFGQIGPKIGFAIGYAIGFVIRLWVSLAARILPLTARMVVGIINFFNSLPGRIAGIILRAATAVITGLGRAISWAVANGPRIAAGILNTLNNLPGRVLGLMIKVGTSIVNAIPGVVASAISLAQQAFDGIMNIINGLPGAVWGALQNVIGAFNDMISAAFNAAAGFAGGLWDGFKKGLGLGGGKKPPKNGGSNGSSGGTGGSSTSGAAGAAANAVSNRLSTQTQQIAGVTQRLVASNNNVAAGLSKLAATTASNRRTNGRMAQATRGRDKTQVQVVAPPAKHQKISGTLSLDERGRVFITGVAEDAAGRSSRAHSRRDRMYR